MCINLCDWDSTIFWIWDMVEISMNSCFGTVAVEVVCIIVFPLVRLSWLCWPPRSTGIKPTLFLPPDPDWSLVQLSALDLSPPLTVIMTALSSETVGSLDWLAYRLLCKLNISYLSWCSYYSRDVWPKSVESVYYIAVQYVLRGFLTDDGNHFSFRGFTALCQHWCVLW